MLPRSMRMLRLVFVLDLQLIQQARSLTKALGERLPSASAGPS